MGNPESIAALRSLLLRVSLGLVFLSETRLVDVWENSVKYKVGFENCLVMDNVGRSGGLMLLWKDSWDVTILSYFIRHIDAWVCPSGST